MINELDKLFCGEDWKDKLNPMEKKKLLDIERERERMWKLASRLENKRNRLRSQLKPNFRKELDKLKDERDILLKGKTEEARQIKEDRKAIRYDFYLKTKHIREDRKKQLESDIKLRNNLKKKNEAWDKMHKKAIEFNDYYRHLREKYVKVENHKQTSHNTDEKVKEGGE